MRLVCSFGHFWFSFGNGRFAEWRAHSMAARAHSFTWRCVSTTLLLSNIHIWNAASSAHIHTVFRLSLSIQGLNRCFWWFDTHTLYEYMLRNMIIVTWARPLSTIPVHSDLIAVIEYSYGQKQINVLSITIINGKHYDLSGCPFCCCCPIS